MGYGCLGISNLAMMKGEKMVKRSSFGTIRKRLSDITNLNSQYRSPAKDKENAPASFDGSSSKNYIELLRKENAEMMKAIQERDKTIEANAIEMQKLRGLIQKIQLQNWQLAQSNSQMLAELNVGKDRLKALNHELACKDALFKAKLVELEEKAKMQCSTDKAQERVPTPEKEAAADHQLQTNKNDEEKDPKNKKRRPARSRSMGPTTSQQAADKEMAESKRHCLRRQSVRLKEHQESQTQVDLFEIDVANFPASHPQLTDESLAKSNLNMTDKEEEGGLERPSNALESERSSIGRPLRRAAAKRGSYTEPRLNVKLRRPE